MKNLFYMLVMSYMVTTASLAMNIEPENSSNMSLDSSLKVELVSPSHLDDIVDFFNNDDIGINLNTLEGQILKSFAPKEDVFYLDPVSTKYYEDRKQIERFEIDNNDIEVISEGEIQWRVIPSSLSAYINEKKIAAENGFQRLFLFRSVHPGTQVFPIKMLGILSYEKQVYSFTDLAIIGDPPRESELIDFYKSLLEKYIPFFHREESADAKFPILIATTNKNLLNYLLSFKLFPHNAHCAFVPLTEVPQDGNMYLTEIQGHLLNVEYLKSSKVNVLKFFIPIKGKLPLKNSCELFRDIKIELQ